VLDDQKNEKKGSWLSAKENSVENKRPGESYVAFSLMVRNKNQIDTVGEGMEGGRAFHDRDSSSGVSRLH